MSFFDFHSFSYCLLSVLGQYQGLCSCGGGSLPTNISLYQVTECSSGSPPSCTCSTTTEQLAGGADTNATAQPWVHIYIYIYGHPPVDKEGGGVEGPRPPSHWSLVSVLSYIVSRFSLPCSLSLSLYIYIYIVRSRLFSLMFPI